MGNRTALTFSNCCEFEANNCLPVTWLALFSPQEFLVERRDENDEKYEVAIYRTSRNAALKRVDQVITSLKGQTPTWAFLRPIEILKDELSLCSSIETIELDITQLWAINKSFQKKVSNAANAFHEMVKGFVGNSKHDIPLLDKLVKEYNLGRISSVANITAEERMFILIGTYWGDPERENLYSTEYFDEAYWKAAL